MNYAPKLENIKRLKYIQKFNQIDRNKIGFISEFQAKKAFLAESRLPPGTLRRIWELSDQNQDGKLDCEEFVIGMHLTESYAKGHVIPDHVPDQPLAKVSHRESKTFGFYKPSAYEYGKSQKDELVYKRKEKEELDRKRNEELEKIRELSKNKQSDAIKYKQELRAQMEKAANELYKKRLRKNELNERRSKLNDLIWCHHARLAQLNAQFEMATLRKKELKKILQLSAEESFIKTNEALALRSKVRALEVLVQGLRKDYNSSEDQLQQLVKDEQKLSREKLDARNNTQVQTDSAIKELIMEAHAHLAEIKILEKRIARDRIDISEKRIVLGRMQTELKRNQEEVYESLIKRSKLDFERVALIRSRKNVEKVLKDQQQKLQREYESREMEKEQMKRLAQAKDHLSLREESIKAEQEIKIKEKQDEENEKHRQREEAQQAESSRHLKLEQQRYIKEKQQQLNFNEKKLVETGSTALPYIALYEYQSTNKSDLCFKEGDLIVVTDQTDNDWWYGYNKDQSGTFPSNYVDALENFETIRHIRPAGEDALIGDKQTFPPDDPNLYEAVYSYSSTEPDDLNFSNGDLIRVTDQSDRDWWYGECRDEKGMFPSSYVKQVSPKPLPFDTCSEMRENLSHSQPIKLASTEVYIIPPTSVSVLDNRLPFSQSKFDTQPEFFSLEESKREIIIAKVIKNFEPDEPMQLKLQIGDCIIVTDMEDFEWWAGRLITEEQKIEKGALGWFPKSCVEVLQKKPAEDMSLVNPLLQVQAVCAYSSQRPNELSFSSGTIIEVIAQSGPHWWKGRIEGQCGYFPPSYVRPVEASSSSLQSKRSSKVCSWNDIFGSAILSTLSAEELKRQKSIYELIETEATYVSDLKAVLEVFYYPMKEAKILSEQMLDDIFLSWKELLEVNEELYDALKKAQQEGHMVVHNVGVILCEAVKFTSYF
ncbi:intersectin-2-like isoform X2 [Zophobas morio]|uniref:intersectin-2-like isoform X2 n=1 Tax=Zophobas morio TaxID=2755281 RepID=UPI003083C423